MTDQKNPQMHVDLMFPSRYLKAADFIGKEVKKTIARVRVEKMRMKDGTMAQKYVIEFADTEKMLVLNRTNANAIAEALGTKKAIEWTGKQITLFPTTCDAFGKTVDCIRVKGTL